MRKIFALFIACALGFACIGCHEHHHHHHKNAPQPAINRPAPPRPAPHPGQPVRPGHAPHPGQQPRPVQPGSVIVVPQPHK